MYKLPKPVRKKPSAKSPLQIEAPSGACTWKIALKYKVKESKISKFTYNCKASPV